MTAEHERLTQSQQRTVYWKRWGSYVSERAWGTVREDYSPSGTAWDYLPTITRAPGPTVGVKTE